MIEVDIDCADQFGCFQTKYGYSSTSANCDPNAFPYYSTVQLFTLPTYLCYNASDNNGNVNDNNFLDHKNKTLDDWGYCVFGKVVDGMSVVDKIKTVTIFSDILGSDHCPIGLEITI